MYLNSCLDSLIWVDFLILPLDGDVKVTMVPSLCYLSKTVRYTVFSSSCL